MNKVILNRLKGEEFGFGLFVGDLVKRKRYRGRVLRIIRESEVVVVRVVGKGLSRDYWKVDELLRLSNSRKLPIAYSKETLRAIYASYDLSEKARFLYAWKGSNAAAFAHVMAHLGLSRSRLRHYLQGE